MHNIILHVCVYVCLHACVHARVHACVCFCACMRDCFHVRMRAGGGVRGGVRVRGRTCSQFIALATDEVLAMAGGIVQVFREGKQTRTMGVQTLATVILPRHSQVQVFGVRFRALVLSWSYLVETYTSPI